MARIADFVVTQFFFVVDRLESARIEAEAKRVGVEPASALCIDLLGAGAPGLHLYALNLSEVAKQIKVNLGSVLV